MNIRSARTPVTVAFAATVACAGFASAQAQTSSARTAAQVLHLHGQITQQQLVDAGPTGPSLGDMQVASGRLTNDAGSRVGSFGFTCTYVRVVGPQISEQCAGWGQLTRGQLTVAGMSRFTDTTHVWAVTGGTGSFAGRDGSIQITDRSDTREDLLVTLP